MSIISNRNCKAMLFVPLYICLLAVLFGGCAKNSKTIIGDYKVIEKSRDDRPDWMGKEVCPQNMVCQKGARTNAHSVEDARTDAYQDAIKQYAMALDSLVKRLYEQGREEAADSESYNKMYKEMIASVNKIRIHNVKVEDFWWEKKRVVAGYDSVKFLYDYHILVTVPSNYWKEQVRKAINRAKENAKQEKQEELLKQMDKFSENIFEELEQI